MPKFNSRDVFENSRINEQIYCGNLDTKGIQFRQSFISKSSFDKILTARSRESGLQLVNSRDQERKTKRREACMAFSGFHSKLHPNL